MGGRLLSGVDPRQMGPMGPKPGAGISKDEDLSDDRTVKRLDHWHLQQPGIVRPSRQHSMRYILHQFLLKQEQRGAPRKKR